MATSRPRSHPWLGALYMAVLACSDSTGPGEAGGNRVSFKLDNQAHVFHSPYQFVNASVDGESFTLDASDDASGLQLVLTGYYGPATYALGPAGPGSARLTVGGVTYTTTGPEDTGSLTITSARCTGDTGYDPLTGITAPVTSCDLKGAFAFRAVSETGQTVRVTEGSFSGTSRRRQS